MIYGSNPRDPLGLNIYTPDITAIMQSGNLYVYGVNNPVMFVDPTGLFIRRALDAVASFVGGVVHGVGETVTYGTLEPAINSLNTTSPPNPTAYQVGRIVGNLGTGYAGAVLASCGVTGGIATAPTGVGAIVGAGVTALGMSIAVSGGVAAVNNTIALASTSGSNRGPQPPSKLKDGERVKTPESHPGEFKKNSDGSFTHDKTGWTAKEHKGQNPHGGPHWDMAPPRGSGHINVGPDGNVFGGSR